MSKNVPSENILKLRKLTEKMSGETPYDDYKVIVKKLKSIVDDGKAEIEKSSSSQSKIKCYESMCSTITKLLTSVTFI